MLEGADVSGRGVGRRQSSWAAAGHPPPPALGLGPCISSNANHEVSVRRRDGCCVACVTPAMSDACMGDGTRSQLCCMTVCTFCAVLCVCVCECLRSFPLAGAAIPLLPSAGRSAGAGRDAQHLPVTVCSCCSCACAMSLPSNISPTTGFCKAWLMHTWVHVGRRGSSKCVAVRQGCVAWEGWQPCRGPSVVT